MGREQEPRGWLCFRRELRCAGHHTEKTELERPLQTQKSSLTQVSLMLFLRVGDFKGKVSCALVNFVGGKKGQGRGGLSAGPEAS